MIDLNTLLPGGSGWNLQTAVAINDAGQIVGTGTLHGVAQSYLLDLNAAPATHDSRAVVAVDPALAQVTASPAQQAGGTLDQPLASAGSAQRDSSATASVGPGTISSRSATADETVSGKASRASPGPARKR